MSVSQRKQEEIAARRSRILDGALEAFTRDGIEGVTMDLIARSAGFGKATLYYYFSSKEEVVSAILENGWQQLLTVVSKPMPESAEPRSEFISIINTLAGEVRENPALFEFLFTAPRLLPPDSEKFNHWKTHQQALYSKLLGLLNRAARRKEITTIEPEILLRAVGSIFHGFLLMGSTDGKFNEQKLDQLVSQILTPQNNNQQ